MQFRANLNTLKVSADELREVSSAIQSFRSDIEEIQRSLRMAHGMTMSGVRVALIAQNIKLQVYQKKMDALANVLNDVEKQYQDTEKRICDYQVAHITLLNSNDTGKEIVSSEQKEEVIRNFEEKHSEEVKNLNVFLHSGDSDDLTETDIREMKYLIYTAEEPYRSIYLNSVSKYKINTTDSGGNAYYQPWRHKVTYSYPDSFGEDPRGDYTVFFHECGHAIDDLSDKAKWIGSDTESFRVYNDEIGKEVTLREAIEFDVYFNPNNPHSMTSIANSLMSDGGKGSQGNIDNVIRAFQLGSSESLSKEDLALYNAVRNQHLRTTGTNESYEAVTDVYGGVSHNTLRGGGYGHDNVYWEDKNKAGMELWAEYFSYNMTKNQDSLGHLVEYFPEASKVMEQYADTLGG